VWDGQSCPSPLILVLILIFVLFLILIWVLLLILIWVLLLILILILILVLLLILILVLFLFLVLLFAGQPIRPHATSGALAIPSFPNTLRYRSISAGGPSALE